METPRSSTLFTSIDYMQEKRGHRHEAPMAGVNELVYKNVNMLQGTSIQSCSIVSLLLIIEGNNINRDRRLTFEADTTSSSYFHPLRSISVTICRLMKIPFSLVL